jgi:DNA adenine methylase
MGGKTRQAGPLSEFLLREASGHTRYFEPFMGSAAVFHKMAPAFEQAVGADGMPDLMLMWQALQRGWTPPDAVSRDEYNALRDADPSSLRGFVGFGCSYGGKFFGGYAEEKVNPKHRNDFVGATKRSVLNRVRSMSKARLKIGDYRDWDVPPDAFVYCDPPYVGTAGYKGAPEFDSDEFWLVVEKWACAGAAVYVSEYKAPDSATCVWERAASVSLRKDDNAASATEKLFRVGVPLP